MGGASIWHWLVVGLVVLLLFGRGKISEMMGDVAKGIKAFKKGMTEEEAPAATSPQAPVSNEPVRTLEHQGQPQAHAPAHSPAHAPVHAPAAAPLGERKLG